MVWLAFKGEGCTPTICGGEITAIRLKEIFDEKTPMAKCCPVKGY